MKFFKKINGGKTLFSYSEPIAIQKADSKKKVSSRKYFFLAVVCSLILTPITILLIKDGPFGASNVTILGATIFFFLIPYFRLLVNYFSKRTISFKEEGVYIEDGESILLKYKDFIDREYLVEEVDDVRYEAMQLTDKHNKKYTFYFDQKHDLEEAKEVLAQKNVISGTNISLLH